jgi:hypothetical protein
MILFKYQRRLCISYSAAFDAVLSLLKIRAKAEGEAWSAIEQFDNACQESVMGDLEQRKNKDK